MVDFWPNDAVLFVLGVGGDKVPDPAGGGGQLARGAAADEVKVGGQVATRLDVDVDRVQVALDDGDQAGEVVVVVGVVVVIVGAARRGSRAVDDLVDGHEAVFVVHGADGRRAAAEGRGGARGATAATGAAGREQVPPEPELLLQDGVAGVGRLHVLVDALDGDVKVEVEGKDGAGDEDDEDGEGSVLKVGHLDLHGAELYPPADVVVGGRRLEAHVLPVGRLEVLKVVRLFEVQPLEVLGEDDDWVADEEVGKMRRQEIVHSPLDELRLDILVDDEVGVHVFWTEAVVR